MVKNNKSLGAVSGVLLILGVVLLVVIIIIFVVLRINATKSTDTKDDATTVQEPPKPVYETQLGDVKFIFISAQNIGNVLKGQNSYQPDVTTTERFIKVTIGAQNKGKVNIKRYTWNMGNIIDSDGRTFVSVDENQGYYSLSSSSSCGSLLKPEFAPVMCEKYYEVSKVSTGLKVEVNISDEGGSKAKATALLDLIVK